MEKFYFPLHVVALVYLAWQIVHADHMGFSWIRGKTAILNRALVRKYHERTWIGLVAIIITGLFLFFDNREFIRYPQFYVKMFFVGTLLVNAVAIGKLSKVTTTKTFSSLSTKEKIPLFISGAISTGAWLGAFAMAYFIL
jgi:hypothetical protein